MIKTFANKETQRLFVRGKSKRLPSELIKRAIRRLEYVNYATSLSDLRVPPSNRLHALKGDRKGQHSISINEQWRICFRFIDGDAYDVEITDYH
ncbi:type II toxin-antitoxin system RelE/ParE family toxin [uncultured Muriicola sp.]|uniref:type II toxin-antitoxin system RelE/ParE family toxin n=1 Tax=uncultured Muriicola sp. TaxID=1583102 RepID=UPI00261B6BF3|nr:type II toxin-antitoxin system RelE/ParE family toxin [uncultured Muriicola sp.]